MNFTVSYSVKQIYRLVVMCGDNRLLKDPVAVQYYRIDGRFI